VSWSFGHGRQTLGLSIRSSLRTGHQTGPRPALFTCEYPIITAPRSRIMSNSHEFDRHPHSHITCPLSAIYVGLGSTLQNVISSDYLFLTRLRLSTPDLVLIRRCEALPVTKTPHLYDLARDNIPFKAFARRQCSGLEVAARVTLFLNAVWRDRGSPGRRNRCSPQQKEGRPPRSFHQDPPGRTRTDSQFR
jgi:hypothetical protein